jgi:hypothetical protein
MIAGAARRRGSRKRGPGACRGAPSGDPCWACSACPRAAGAARPAVARRGDGLRRGPPANAPPGRRSTSPRRCREQARSPHGSSPSISGVVPNVHADTGPATHRRHPRDDKIAYIRISTPPTMPAVSPRLSVITESSVVGPAIAQPNANDRTPAARNRPRSNSAPTRRPAAHSPSTAASARAAIMATWPQIDAAR